MLRVPLRESMESRAQGSLTEHLDEMGQPRWTFGSLDTHFYWVLSIKGIHLRNLDQIVALPKFYF